MSDERLTEHLGQTTNPSNPETGRRFHDTQYYADKRWSGAVWRAPTMHGAHVYHTTYFFSTVNTWVTLGYNAYGANYGATQGGNGITIRVDGWYMMYAGGYQETAYPGTLAGMRIRVNSNVIVEWHDNTDSYNAGFWVGCVALYPLSAGTYIDAQQYQNSRNMYFFNARLFVKLV